MPQYNSSSSARSVHLREVSYFMLHHHWLALQPMMSLLKKNKKKHGYLIPTFAFQHDTYLFVLLYLLSVCWVFLWHYIEPTWLRSVHRLWKVQIWEKTFATSGNRTRASRVAGENSTTEPTLLEVTKIITFPDICQFSIRRKLLVSISFSSF